MLNTLEPPIISAGDQRKPLGTDTPAPLDEGPIAVNECLAAAAETLKFDIAELWRFGPDAALRTTGVLSRVTPTVGGGAAAVRGKPSCEHVYAQSAILKTYTGRIMGIWNSGFDDSKSSQNHVLSPSVSTPTRLQTLCRRFLLRKQREAFLSAAHQD